MNASITPTPLPPTPTPTPAPGSSPYKDLTIVGFVLAFLAPLIGLILSIIAFTKAKSHGLKNGLALAGMIIGVIGTVVWAIALVFITQFAINSLDATTSSQQVQENSERRERIQANLVAIEGVSSPEVSVYYSGLQHAMKVDFVYTAKEIPAPVLSSVLNVLIKEAQEGSLDSVPAGVTITATTTDESGEEWYVSFEAATQELAIEDMAPSGSSVNIGVDWLKSQSLY